MANCGIMRAEKRGRGGVYGLQIEANRTQEDHERGRDFDRSDIDWNATQDNVHLRYCENWNQEITRQIHDAGVKERKDSIVMIDALYTASPEFFEGKSRDEIVGYFKDCLDFHEREYGRAFNAVIHFDETTPHMQVASVPIVEDGKGAHLSAKIVMGGRADYRARQDRFYDDVTKHYGLERGEIRDPAEIKAHTTKREWQIATQEQRLEQARKETKAEQARTQEVIARRQASIELASAQKMEALRERDAARAERDVVKALSGLQKGVRSPQSVEVDILAERDAKRSFTGKETPATVTISRDDFERLQQQAIVNSRTREAAEEIGRVYKGMQTVAREINVNRIDKQAAANAAAVSAEGRRADTLERELERTRQALTQEKQKTMSLSRQLAQERAERQETRDVLAFFSEQWDDMKERTKRARTMEKLYEERNSSPAWSNSFGRSYVRFEGQEMGIRAFLQQYLDECERQDIPHETGMREHLENLLSRDRDCGLSR